MIMESPRPVLAEPIGVVGYGVEGRSTARYLLARGFRDITVFDKAGPRDLEAGLRRAAPGADGDWLEGLARMRTVFRSAGVRPDLPALAEFAAAGGTLTSQVGLAFSLAGPGRIIGVTGTLGKGTCCSLLEAMLREAGIKAALGGNIGVPALDLAADLEEGALLILELSSFQLSALPVSPRIAVVLRTTSEHLDWHLSQREYWEHKGNLAAHQGPGDLLVHCADAPGSVHIAGLSAARKLSFGAGPGGPGAGPDIRIAGDRLEWVTRGFTLSLAETRLKGGFNLENLAAAAAVALELGADPARVKAAAAAFAGLEHRLEFVREHRGIAYWNDSYATRPEAALGAVAALSDRPLGLILGGSEKHADFRDLAAAIAGAGHVRAIAFIGQTGERLREELLRAGVGRPGRACPAGAEALRRFPRLEEASLAEAMAFLASALGAGAGGPGGPIGPAGHIALSPACASFGMFENYKERGKAFKRLVRALV
jgi:UDP-N-acetylmuramoylalanine--D-glutamate ligase